MILQTSFRHKLINQKPVVAIWAVPNELNQIRVVKPTKVVYLCL